MNEETRNQIQGNLEYSAAMYAGFSEQRISDLRQACLMKYYPQQYVHSAEVSNRPQDVPSKKAGGLGSALFRGRREVLKESQEKRKSAKPKIEEGAADLIYVF